MRAIIIRSSLASCLSRGEKSNQKNNACFNEIKLFELHFDIRLVKSCSASLLGSLLLKIKKKRKKIKEN